MQGTAVAVPVQDTGESDGAYRAEVDRYRDSIVDAALFVFDRLFLAAAGLCLVAALLSLRLRGRHVPLRP